MKVAILGGGMASLAAAWELANTKTAQFEITVYQQDHLLGGKGAAVRHKLPGGQERIEEHGIHILFGFYTELMGMLEKAYAAAPESDAWGTLPHFSDALSPNDWAFLAEEYPGDGNWCKPWAIQFPQLPGQPWDGKGATNLQTLFNRLLTWLIDLAEVLDAAIPKPVGPPLSLMSGMVKFLLSQSGIVLNQPASPVGNALTKFAEDLLRAAWKLAKPLLGIDAVRRSWIGIYLAGTVLRGLLTSGILVSRDFESINDQDFRDWLAAVDPFQPGEVPPRLSWASPPVVALYDVVFSRSTTFAAGVMLRDALELVLGYRGHLSYRMNGSMGEVVFSPLYLALLKKGVKFEFFHKLTRIEVANHGAGPVVDKLHFEQRPAPSFAPLVKAAGSGAPAWPREPASTPQSAESRDLQRGVDFHVAVLGIGIGEFDADDPNNVVFEVCQHSPGFKAMVKAVGTAATQAAQLWLDKSVSDLGWPHGPQDGPMYISYARPMNSWADMTHLLKYESWSNPPQVSPASLAYFADELLPNEGTDADHIKVNARNWLDAEAGRVWPKFAFDDLNDPAGSTGQQRLDCHYFRANTEGTDRYTLSEKGTIHQRLKAHESGLRNLALAGDWVLNRLNAGSVEAATLAGVAAGRAIIDGTVSS